VPPPPRVHRQPGPDRTLIRSVSKGFADPALVCVTAGPDAGKTVAIGAAPLVVGTSAGCTLLLADPHVSRRHLEIQRAIDGFTVRDLHSSNGTWYHGSRIGEATLPLGATLCVGDTRLALLPSHELIQTLPHPDQQFGSLVGVSLPMRRLFSALQAAAGVDEAVLVSGEEGSGKTAVARELHARSRRAQGPLVIMELSGLPAARLERELFGSTGGSGLSHTAAAFERAAGGTLVLEDIGLLPGPLQERLFAVLKNGVLPREGQAGAVAVDVRLVCTTRQDLIRLVRRRVFKAELYYRVSIAELRLPSLRERPEDVPALVARLLERLARGRPVLRPGPGTLEMLQHHRWPGNVRELEAVVERAVDADSELQLQVALADSSRAHGVPPMADLEGLPFDEARRRMMDAFEREFLRRLCERCGGDAATLERESGLDPARLRALLEGHGLVPPCV
jgi:two-component system, NtrC family, nitrogen regulation response regulator GlnG